MPDQLFNKKEISEILKKASEIQTQKDLYGDKEGLNKEELIALAKEVGIDQDSLIQALDQKDSFSFENKFDWFSGTSKVQNIAVVDGEINDDNWDEIIREIRKVIGGIGKDSNHRTSYEWEQRLKEIGYRHISLTPENGKTKIQYVYNWKGLRFMSNLFGFIFPAVAVAGSVEVAGFTAPLLLFVASLGGLAGVLLTRLFLKPYFEKQKRLMNSVINAISQKLATSGIPSVMIEEDAYSESSNLNPTISKDLLKS